MLGNKFFSHRTIRKVVVAFGTLFNDILVTRTTQSGVQKEHFKVPLSYGPKEKYLTLITSDPTLTKSIATVVPRISFSLDGLSYDPTRKQMTTLRNFSANSSTTVKTQFAPIPYNYEFSLSIYVRNTEDGTQILEQILPFFTPDFNVTVDFIPGMDQKYDLPIILNSVTSSVDYEGDMSTTRLILWDLSFTVKGFIWPPVKPSDGEGGGKIIRRANTNIYIEPQSLDGQVVYVDFANGTGQYQTSENIRVEDRQLTGKVLYFSNSNTGTLIVGDLNKYLQVGDKVVGDFSNASFTINSLESTPLHQVKVLTTPDPISAEPDDAFGFNQTITYWPNL
jgi:hypothetical protein